MEALRQLKLSEQKPPHKTGKYFSYRLNRASRSCVAPQTLINLPQLHNNPLIIWIISPRQSNTRRKTLGPAPTNLDRRARRVELRSHASPSDVQSKDLMTQKILAWLESGGDSDCP